MADEIEFAARLEQAHIETALALAPRVTFEAWVPGICEECGDETPRLVEGKCAPCREPRFKPPKRY